MSGGVAQASPSGTGTVLKGLCYNSGGPVSTPWWRHFSTIQLDQVLCPSFAGDPGSTMNVSIGGQQSYSTFGSSGGLGMAALASATPGTPWSTTITNYKAMVASHFACVNPTTAQAGGQTSPQTAEAPNGVLIPPDPNAPTNKGLNLRSVSDGASKTIVVAESKEQMFSSWYDGTTSWVVAIANGNGSSVLNPMTSNPLQPPQPTRITVTANTAGAQPMFFWDFVNPQPAITPTSGLNFGPGTNPMMVYSNWQFMTGSSAMSSLAGQSWSWGPSSDHSGGIVLHAWGDAHVSGLPSDTAANVYLQLCTRAGREPVSDPSQQQ